MSGAANCYHFSLKWLEGPAVKSPHDCAPYFFFAAPFFAGLDFFAVSFFAVFRFAVVFFELPIVFSTSEKLNRTFR
jgi:hypothetical protein